MDKQFKNHKEFFDRCGDQYIHTKSYGECIYSVSVEEMYKHFRARFCDEFNITDSPHNTFIETRT